MNTRDFLRALEGGASVIDAAGSDARRRELYRLRFDSPKFERLWTRAFARGTAALERELRRRRKP